MKYLILLALLLAACSAPPREFTVAQVPYDVQNCTSTSYGDGTLRAGMRLSIISENGTPIESATFRAQIDTTGFGGAPGEEFSCIEEADNLTVELNVRAPGHLPTALAIPLQPDKLSTITVRLKPGCLAPGSAPEERRMMDIVEQQLGWNRDEYSISCLEYNPGRGGYVQAKGTRDGAPFTVRYRWGWCSSGGSDCGFEACLSMNAATPSFTDFRNRICDKLQSTNGDTLYCQTASFDNSTAVQEACRQGAYDISAEDRITFSVSQISNRCQSRVEAGPKC
jgi:hypothetical protein